MPDTKLYAASRAHENEPDRARRDFLLLLPFGILAGIAATLTTAAFRFLRPAAATTNEEARWIDVAPVSQLTGDKPVMRSISVERRAGWSSTREEYFVFVLPGQNQRVVSSACPHEGCTVDWQTDANNFSCPCHDSFFAPDGSRLAGPAMRGLDLLPSREKDGVLQVQYQSFTNNTAERTVRG